MTTPDGPPAARRGSGLTGVVLDGRYRVGAMIARGGMSTVYRGVDTRLDRAVAIKVMSPSYTDDQTFLARFEREARLAAGLAHPGVVAVYDQGRDGDVVFLVMELIDGGTLRDLIRQSGGLSVSVTMSILEPLLSALGAAHAAGLVHRDVKPENVLISSRGQVKVADFGLVRAITSQTMATGDIILGTVAYLSPEQVATGAADARSDVYSAGIVAFEMLTGRTPYIGDNAISVAYAHVHSDVPPVTDTAPGVPVELDDLVLAATRRDPMARPRDASAFLAALVSIRARLGLTRVPVPVPTPARRPPGRASTGRASTGLLAPTGRTPIGRAAGHTISGAPTMGPVGPSGTRVVGTRSPATVATVDPRRLEVHPAPLRGRRTSRRMVRFRRWIVVVIVVLLLGAAAAVGGWWLGSGRWAYTPATVGVDRQSAETMVRGAGLVPNVLSAPDNTIPPGTVSASDPGPGTRELRGSPVDLTVSTGRPLVPKVSPGTAVTQAAAQVIAAHLTPAYDVSVDEYSNTVPYGTVLSTEPDAGSAWPISAKVLLVKSKGAEPQPVPDVNGKSVEDAQNKILVDGFTLGADVRQFDAVADPGTVLGTVPGNGTLLPRGSAVSLLLATSITVPSVRGETTTQATIDLQAAGLTVSVGEPTFDADIDAGSVIGTTPAAGGRVDPAAPAVIITASNAVVVPLLTDTDVRTAKQRLADLGLGSRVSAMFGADSSSVLGQTPNAGSRIAPGSTVTFSAFP